MIATESNTLSATGSIKSCISSFTDTIGFMAPHSAGSGLPPGGTLVVAAVEEGDEQAVIEASAISPAAAMTFRARGAVISTPVQAGVRLARREPSRGSMGGRPWRDDPTNAA